MDLQALRPERRPRAADTDQPVDVDDRDGPVDLEVVGGELVGVRHLTVLRVGVADPLGDRGGERLDEQLGARR